MSTATDHRPSGADSDTLAHVILQLRDELIAQAGHAAALQAALNREHETRIAGEASAALELEQLRRRHAEDLAAVEAARVQALSDLSHQFTGSATWGVGKALLAPARLVKRLGNRT